MGDLSLAKNRMKETFGPGVASISPEESLTELFVSYRKAAADGMASTTTANDKYFTNPFPYALRLVQGKINPDAALTQDTANKARVQVKVDDGAAGTPTVALEWETNTVANGGTGSWSTGVSVAAAGSNNVPGTRLPVGANLFFAIAKDGTGVVVPVCSVCVRLSRID